MLIAFSGRAAYVRQLILGTLASIGLLLTVQGASAELPPQPIDHATLIVEGTVQAVFHHLRTHQVDYVFCIQVRSARLGKDPEAPYNGAVPKEGDSIYVHAFQRTADAPNMPGPGGYRTLPAEQDIIVAYLFPASGGRWEFAYPIGFEKVGHVEEEMFPASREAPLAVKPMPPRRLGINVTPVRVDGRSRLQIVNVAADSPAAAANLKVGDFILTAGGAPMSSVRALNAQVTGAGVAVHLDLLRSGLVEQVRVPLDATGEGR